LSGGQILSTSFASGKAGTLTFDVKDKIILSGSDANYSERSQLPGFNDASNTGAASGLFANTVEGATGAGGDLQIRTGKLLIEDGAGVSVSNLGTGNAGNLLVNADSIRLRNTASLSAESRAGSQGNIILNAGDLILREGSNVTTNATGLATGGNIKIDSAVIAGFENSDISANAVEGNGGQIDIITQGIFGLEFRDELTESSDITASSEFGVNGTVAINNISIDPSSGLVELPVDLADGSQQIASGCANKAGNSFVATGRGGIPKNPNEQIDINPTWSDIRDLSAFRKQNNNIQTTEISNKPAIVEATGFIRNQDGEIELVALKNSPFNLEKVVNCSVTNT
jgi:large exoprotein involved in heme utilization and adhesion